MFYLFIYGPYFSIIQEYRAYAKISQTKISQWPFLKIFTPKTSDDLV